MKTLLKKFNWLTCSFILSVIFWGGLLFSQILQLVNPNKVSVLAGKIEFLVHFFTLIMVFSLFKKIEKEDQKTLGWFFLANICLFLNDASFYFGVYFQKNYILSTSFLTFILGYIPYLIWILSIMIFLSKILVRHIFNVFYFFKALPFFILINLLVTYLFFSSVNYAFDYLSWESISHILSFMSEFIIFEITLLLLIYSENKGFSLTLLGFTTLISGDFFVNYSFISQTTSLLNYGELLWFLGLIFILFSTILIHKNKSYSIKKWFSRTNTIKNRLAFWSFGTSILSFLLFFILAYIFSAINTQLFLGLPIFIMMYSVIVIISSIHMGKRFESPFKKLTANVAALMLNNDKNNIDDNFSTQEFVFLQKFITEAFDIKEQKERAQQALLNLTAQVAHDIRSPLAAINTAVANVTSIPENNRIMIRNAATRINDIANNLLLQSQNNLVDPYDKKTNQDDYPELIFIILDNLVAEKRYEYYKQNINIKLNISESSYNCFSRVNLSSFTRILSNIINNSIEAIGSEGVIDISLTNDDSIVKIVIEDNGCGIPSDVLPKIAELGFSFNKNNGAGLGLSFTKKYIEQINGTMHIDSKINFGTKILLQLNRSTSPKWFCDSITIRYNTTIVILDDDQSIHDAWNERFSTIPHIKLIHLYSMAEQLKYKNDPLRPVLYLVDYELVSENKNGLDVIEKLALNDRAILVTSCFEEKFIRTRCENMGVKIIPKPFVPYIKITQELNTEQDPLLVFIDNDEIMRTTWAFAASEADKKIATYSSVEEFITVINEYAIDTIIYIDSDLDQGIRGEIEAKKLFDLGFKEIYLATGHAPNKFNNIPYIKSIVGKEPPF